MKIKLHDLEAEIIKLAIERPDFTYSTPGECSYVGTDKGVIGGEACIVGQALQRLGVPEEFLREWENSTIDTTFDDLVGAKNDLHFDEDDYTAYSFISEVQRKQDMGLEWREAVALSNLNYPNPERIINV